MCDQALGEAKIITLVDASAFKQEVSSAEGGRAILEDLCSGGVGSILKQSLKENQLLNLTCAETSNCSTRLVVHRALSASFLFECTVAASLVSSPVSISLVVELGTSHFLNWVRGQHWEHAVTPLFPWLNGEAVHSSEEFGAARIDTLLFFTAFDGLKHVFLRLLLAFLLLLYSVRGSLIDRLGFFCHAPFSLTRATLIVALIA
jgi:hypothetical protein